LKSSIHEVSEYTWVVRQKASIGKRRQEQNLAPNAIFWEGVHVEWSLTYWKSCYFNS
jgi:hypothetical protein